MTMMMMNELLYLFLSQFAMVGLLGLQSKFNRDNKVLLLGINSYLISYIQADVFIEDITFWYKNAFALGGAVGIMITSALYERFKGGFYVDKNVRSLR